MTSSRPVQYVLIDESCQLATSLESVGASDFELLRPKTEGTVVLAGGAPTVVAETLGRARLEIGRQLYPPPSKNWSFVWIDEMPLVEWSDSERRWYPKHHRFSRPTPEWEATFGENPDKSRAMSYDLVLNGTEIGSGSFRIHEPDLQRRFLDLLTVSLDVRREKLGVLLDALSTGAPPHGGIAIGIERLAMILCGEFEISAVEAFPKDENGVDTMTGAPSRAPRDRLERRKLSVSSSMRCQNS